MATDQSVPIEEPGLSPAGGKVLVWVNSQTYGRVPMYVDPSISPARTLEIFTRHMVPLLQQERESTANRAALENAQISIPFTKATIPGQNLIGLGHGLNRWIAEPVKQLFNTITGNEAAEAQRKERFARGEEVYSRLAKQSFPARSGDFTGQMLPAVAASLVAPAAAPQLTAALNSRLIPSILNAGTQGGIIGAIPEPGAGGSRAENAIENAGMAALFQAPFATLGSIAAGPKNMLSAPQREAVEAMQRVPGYKPLPSQLTGNPNLAKLERVLGYFPFSAGKMEERVGGNRAAISGELSRILQMPEGTTYPTAAALFEAQRASTKVLNAVEKSGIVLKVSDEAKQRLAMVRDEALQQNTPPTKTISTINKFLGDASPELRPEIANMGSEWARDQAVRQLGLAAFQPRGKNVGAFAGGTPMRSINSVLSDFSQWSHNGDYLAGAAKSVLQEDIVGALNAAVPDARNILKMPPYELRGGNVVPTTPIPLGDAYQQARWNYGALETARPAIDPATGLVSPPKLAQSLSSGRDVYGFGESSNPRLVEMGDLARNTRGTPPPPEAGSQTASNLAWQRALGTMGAAGSGLAGYLLKGGGLEAPTLSQAGAGIAASTLPFIAANYGAKAYLSPAVARWAQEGIPTFADLLQWAEPVIAAGVQGGAAGATR